MARIREPGKCDVPFFHALICTHCERLKECQKLVGAKQK